MLPSQQSNLSRAEARPRGADESRNQQTGTKRDAERGPGSAEPAIQVVRTVRTLTGHQQMTSHWSRSEAVLAAVKPECSCRLRSAGCCLSLASGENHRRPGGGQRVRHRRASNRASMNIDDQDRILVAEYRGQQDRDVRPRDGEPARCGGGRAFLRGGGSGPRPLIVHATVRHEGAGELCTVKHHAG